MMIGEGGHVLVLLHKINVGVCRRQGEKGKPPFRPSIERLLER